MSKQNRPVNQIARGDPIKPGNETLIVFTRKIPVRFGFLGAQADGGMEHVQPPGVVAELGDVSRRVPIEDMTGAALRSMLIGAVIVGGLTWLVRVFIARRRNNHD